MPTMRSTSADLAVTSSLECLPCARIASLNWAPIVLTGFSAFIALCMTTDMSRQRIAESCPSVSPTRFVPSNVTLPAAIVAGRSEQLGDGEQQRRLPAARFAHDAEELAPADRERHVVHRPDGPPVQEVVDGQAADLKHRRVRHRGSAPFSWRIFRTGRRAGLPISSKA